jgi:hypothetical protein
LKRKVLKIMTGALLVGASISFIVSVTAVGTIVGSIIERKRFGRKNEEWL